MASGGPVGAQRLGAEAARQFRRSVDLAVLVFADLDPPRLPGKFLGEGASLARSQEDAEPPADPIDAISRAFAEHGGEAYGERVSQLDHALQCAELAAAEGAGLGLGGILTIVPDLGIPTTNTGRSEPVEATGARLSHSAV